MENNDKNELTSLTPHGVSGLKFQKINQLKRYRCLTPHGVSGLKFAALGDDQVNEPSHPAWGEWIEIDKIILPKTENFSLTPHGVSGLKYDPA